MLFRLKNCFLNVLFLVFISSLLLSSCQNFEDENEVGEDITFPEEMPPPLFEEKTLGDYDTRELLSKGEEESKKHNNLVGERKYGKTTIDQVFVCKDCLINEEDVFFLFLLKNGEYSIEYGKLKDLLTDRVEGSNNVMIYSRGHYQKGKSAEGNSMVTLSSFFIPSFLAYYRTQMVSYSGVFYADVTDGPLLIEDWSALKEKSAVYEVLKLEEKEGVWIEANSKTKFVASNLF